MSVEAANAGDADVIAIVQAIERAQAAGQRSEAGRLLERARAIAPEHPLVLNVAGIEELHRGNASAARQLLEKAIEKDGRNPAFWLNLATAFRRLGLQAEEARALDRALALEPRHLLALLQKASLLELQGKRKMAAQVYHNALQTIPRGARLPQNLRSAIQRAVDAVRRNDAALEAFLATRLEDVRRQHASEKQDRFDHCIDAFLGKRRIYEPKPTFLCFPKLPPLEFHPREDFPWLEEIEAGTERIRAEFERVYAEDAGGLRPYIAYPESAPLDQWAELNHSRRWSAYFLWKDGKPVEEHLARCPQTAELLRRIPRVDVPGYAPTAFFSILDARTRIPPHTGATNTRLIVHLPLVVPPGCRFRVGSETREWRVGKAWVFDDTIEHEAWNDSDTIRAILIFDVWNPGLTEAERALVRTAVQSIKEYYADEGMAITAE